MKWHYHWKMDDICIYDHEPWPCTAAGAVLDFVRDSEDAILITLVEQTFKVSE